MSAIAPLAVVEIKAFVSAKDFALSQQFFRGLGFTEPARPSWAMVDFSLSDPRGVLWRIGQNVPRMVR